MDFQNFGVFVRFFVRSFVRSFAVCLFVCFCLFLCVLKNVVVTKKKGRKGTTTTPSTA